MKKLPENADSISGSFFVESEIELEGLNRKIEPEGYKRACKISLWGICYIEDTDIVCLYIFVTGGK